MPPTTSPPVRSSAVRSGATCRGRRADPAPWLVRHPARPNFTSGLELGHFRRNVLDLAGDDVGADLHHLRDLGLRNLRADLAEADTVVLEAEDDVAALELAVDDELDRVEHRGVDPLHRAGEDVRPEERLVGVDADAPDALLLRGVERAAAAPG